MTVKIELTNQEASFLRDIIEWWAEGYVDAEGMTLEQAQSIDELLDLTSGYSEQTTMCKSILDKIPRKAS